MRYFQVSLEDSFSHPPSSPSLSEAYGRLSGKSCKLKSKLVTLGSNGVFTLPFGLLENLPDCPILYQPTSLSVRLSRTLRHLYKVPEGHDASVAQGGALLPSSQGSASPVALTQRISITTRGPRIWV